MPISDSFDFGSHFWEKHEKSYAQLLINYKLPTDFIDFRWQIRDGLKQHCVQILRNLDKNCDRESAAYEKCKMAAMTSSNWDIQNLRKKDTGPCPRDYLCEISLKSA